MSRVYPIRQSEPEAPPDRGRLMTAEQVASELFAGSVSPQWVRRNAPKVRLGHSTVRFFEFDIRDWLMEKRESA